ncbi:MAG: DNA polymerase I [Pseudopedobacter sp.]|nr:DNA polymerase I [Deinococcales bacterium]
MTVPNAREKNCVVLVDGHALAYRSYFAIQHDLTTSTGVPVKAILGFIKALLKVLKDNKCGIIVTFDAPVRTFRHEQFEGYKSGRAKMPEDLPGQIQRIKKIVELMNIVHLELPGFEADDILGTLTGKATLEGYEVRILTSDRDSYQLISESVSVIRSDHSLMTPAGVLEKYGVTVGQWVDYRALTGDSSDNIPGAKGIGEKTAAKLLQDYGSLDRILEEADAGTLLPVKVGDKVRTSRENVVFSREMSRMVLDLPIEMDFGEVLDHQPNLEALIEELQTLEMKTLVAEVSAQAVAKGKPSPYKPPLTSKTQQSPLFNEPAALELTDWTLPSAETGDVVWGYTLSKEFDLTAQMLEVGFTDGDKIYQAQVDPERGVDYAAFSSQKVLNAANAKALSTHLSLHGVSVEPGEDPLLMAYQMDTSVTTEKEMAFRHAGLEWPKDAGSRARITRDLLQSLPAKLNEAQKSLYEDLEKPLSKVLARMELHGIRVDVPYLKALSDSLGVRLERLEIDIQEQAGRPFKISSRDQLETVLFDELKLSAGKKTKAGGKRSTAVATLEPLRDVHPIVPLILEYRELSKLKSTYLDALPALVLEHTGRVHTTLQQTAVATGRLSSLNPNLQNIPIRSELGREIRKGFIADEGFALIAADYSQIELRLMAHISQDPIMLEAFREGADIHRRTAAQILGVLEENVTTQQRRAAKTINFGVLYGMSAHRLSGDVGLPFKEAQGFIARYFALYPNIRGYIDRTLEFCREKGYVETLMGRRRFVPEVNSSNRNVREAAERVAYNMPIQGTAADIIKIAMVRLEPKLIALGARLLLQVHDELIVESPLERVEEVKSILLEEMRGAFTLDVPLEVEVGVGANWFEAK